MKILWALSVAGSVASAAPAQVTSVSDPSAYRPDQPVSQKPSNQTPAKAVASGGHSSASEAAKPEAAPSAPNYPSESTPVAALNLVCGGGGTANKLAVATVYGSSSTSGMVGTAPISLYGSGSSTITTQRQQGFADQVDVRLFSGDDRIRMPRTMLPPIRGGSDGWFKLKNVKVTDRAITASAAVNFINSPKVHIDRLTGTIAINGKAGSYSGQCEAVDPNAQRRF